MTRSDQQLKALPCPDPECGGEVSMLAGGSMGALCGSCGKRWSTRSYAQQLAQVRAELEEARGSLSEWVADGKAMEARIASLERELREARERAGLFELFDCYEVTTPDGTHWQVEGCYSDDTETEPSAWGVCVMHLGEWQEAHAHETRDGAISALRAELALASHSVEEDDE